MLVKSERFEPGEWARDESFFMHTDGNKLTSNPANSSDQYGPLGIIIGLTPGGKACVDIDEGHSLLTQALSVIEAQIV